MNVGIGKILVAAIAMAVSLGAAVAGAHVTVPLLIVILGALTILACLVASMVRDKAESDHLGLNSLVLIHLVLGFGVGNIYYLISPVSDARLQISDEAFAKAATMGAIAALMVSAGYWTCNAKVHGPGLADILDNATRQAASPLGILFIEGVGWYGRSKLVSRGQYFHISDQATQDGATAFVATVAGLPTLAMLIAVAHRWNQQRPLRSIWLLIVAEFAWHLPSGTRASIVAMMVALLVLRKRLGGSLPKTWLAAGATFCIFVLFPLVSTYRGYDSDYSRDVQTSAATAMTETFDRPKSDIFWQGTEATLSRFSDGLSAAAALDRNQVDGSEVGRPLTEYLVTAPFPRMIVHDKADPGTFGNEFGRAYGLIRNNDLFTSIAVSQPLHGYLRGDWPGVVVMTFFAGLGYRCLYHVFKRDSIVMQALYAAFAFSAATSIGTIWPLGFVGLCKSLLFTIIILIIASQLSTRMKYGGWRAESKKGSDWVGGTTIQTPALHRSSETFALQGDGTS